MNIVRIQLRKIDKQQTNDDDEAWMDELANAYKEAEKDYKF